MGGQPRAPRCWKPFNSGMELLRASAAQHDGPEGVAELESQYAEAMKLVPR